MDYQPDGYQFLLINNEIVKLFSSWSGGFAQGDSWRLNSGCESIVEKKDYYLIYSYSGSVYKLRKSGGHINHYCRGVLNKILEQDFVKEISVQEAIEFLKENNV